MALFLELHLKKWSEYDFDCFTKAMAGVQCNWWVNEKTGQAWIGNFELKDLIYISNQLWYFKACFY